MNLSRRGFLKGLAAVASLPFIPKEDSPLLDLLLPEEPQIIPSKSYHFFGNVRPGLVVPEDSAYEYLNSELLAYNLTLHKDVMRLAGGFGETQHMTANPFGVLVPQDKPALAEAQIMWLDNDDPMARKLQDAWNWGTEVKLDLGGHRVTMHVDDIAFDGHSVKFGLSGVADRPLGVSGYRLAGNDGKAV